jgi:hypothetical protein
MYIINPLLENRELDPRLLVAGSALVYRNSKQRISVISLKSNFNLTGTPSDCHVVMETGERRVWQNQ